MVGAFDNIFQCESHRVLLGEKSQICLQNKAQTWKFAICISIIKASRRKHFLPPQTSFFEDTYQHPMELLVPVGNADLNRVPQIWPIFTLTWDTFWHRALWSHTRAAGSDSLKLKKSSRSFLINWTVSLVWGHRSKGYGIMSIVLSCNFASWF